MLIWLEPYHNNAPVLGFHVMYSEEYNTTRVVLESEEEILHIPDLLPGVTYQFTVVAFNDIGDSVTSDVYNVTTLEEGKPSKPLTNLSITNLYLQLLQNLLRM